jgi:hypothetical protein
MDDRHPPQRAQKAVFGEFGVISRNPSPKLEQHDHPRRQRAVS